MKVNTIVQICVYTCIAAILSTYSGYEAYTSYNNYKLSLNRIHEQYAQIQQTERNGLINFCKSYRDWQKIMISKGYTDYTTEMDDRCVEVEK